MVESLLISFVASVAVELLFRYWDSTRKPRKRDK